MYKQEAYNTIAGHITVLIKQAGLSGTRQATLIAEDCTSALQVLQAPEKVEEPPVPEEAPEEITAPEETPEETPDPAE